MWNCHFSHLKYSLLGSAMLVLAGCSTNPRSLSAVSPAQQATEPAKNRVVQAHQKTKPHTVQLAKARKVPAASTLEKVTWCARKQQGKMYCWGGSSPTTGFDCSGLTQYSFKQGAGVNLPRTAAAQYQAAEKVNQQEARKGDLVFFSHGRRISHVGIVYDVNSDGDIKFIHAATSKGVMISSLHDSYWGPRFRFGKRIIANDNLVTNN